MWYFSWVLGLGFACTFAILNAMWLESRETIRTANSPAPSMHLDLWERVSEKHTQVYVSFGSEAAARPGWGRAFYPKSFCHGLVTGAALRARGNLDRLFVPRSWANLMQ